MTRAELADRFSLRAHDSFGDQIANHADEVRVRSDRSRADHRQANLVAQFPRLSVEVK